MIDLKQKALADIREQIREVLSHSLFEHKERSHLDAVMEIVNPLCEQLEDRREGESIWDKKCEKLEHDLSEARNDAAQQNSLREDIHQLYLKLEAERAPLQERVKVLENKAMKVIRSLNSMIGSYSEVDTMALKELSGAINQKPDTTGRNDE